MSEEPPQLSQVQVWLARNPTVGERIVRTVLSIMHVMARPFRPHLTCWSEHPTQGAIEDNTKAIPYLAYTLLAWISVFASTQAASSEGSSGQGDLALFLGLREATPDAVFPYVRVFVLWFLGIHAFRVFMGAYFVRHDDSWVEAREKWYQTLDPKKRSKARATETSLIIVHIFLLGLLLLATKGQLTWGAPAVMVAQGVLFLVSLIYFSAPLMTNSPWLESALIAFTDALTLVASLTLLAALLGLPVPTGWLLATCAITFGLSLFELLFVYLGHLVAAGAHFAFLIAALAGRRMVKEAE